MIAQQKVIKHSELILRLVLDRRTAEEVGRVEQLWLNTQFHQVVGFTCKSGFLGNKKRSFTWEQIESIGTDSILVNPTTEGSDPQKPENVISVVGHEVWTDAGNKVGKVVDYLVVPQTSTVVGYLFVSSGWRGVLDGIYLLSPFVIASVGSKRMIVADATVQEPQHYAEGLNQKLSQATDFLKEDYEKTMRDLEAVKRGTQDMAEQFKDKAQAVTDIAKEKASEVNVERQDTSLPPAENTIEIKAELLPKDAEPEERR
jgi:uncharacterized protein YrrD